MKKLKTILLVDDDEISNFLAETIIHDLDIANEVKISKNGKEALDMLGQCTGEPGGNEAPCPELVLLDINMPVMDGFEFLEAFEKLQTAYHQLNPTVVMLTSSCSIFDLEKAKHFKISGFINKPLTEKSLKVFLDDA